ncbi:ATP-binding protein [Nocardioides sp. GCM10027113]|uniref:sensor histidine kinase n=1 Tax=unclassified Nocardioides TaxID=2615069 RepID=UPI003624214E
MPSAARTGTPDVERYDVLHRPPRRDLVALAEIAAQVAGAPMATVNLFTDSEQHQVATAGFDAAVCDRKDSMCAHVVDSREAIVVEDARHDPRFRDNPFVCGPLGSVRFYASHLLTAPSGAPIGTLAVFDTEPRSLDAEARAALQALADRVVDLLELDLRTRELEATVHRLEVVQADLERSNGRLAGFAGQASHDLRNPLAALTFALSDIEYRLESAAGAGTVEDPEKLLWLAQRGSAAAARMEGLIGGMLAFARLGGSARHVPVDLGTVMTEVREDLAELLRGATLFDGELPTVTGDPVQLRAALQNLVANAAKFTLPGHAPVIRVSAERCESGWRVAVADRGPGVPKGQRHRIFEPLARLDERVEGIGLGLATVTRIIDAHGGDLGVEENPGGGAVFWFTVPD